MTSDERGDMDDPTLWSTRQQAAAISKRELSSRELLDLYVDRIEHLGPPVNAVVTFDMYSGFGMFSCVNRMLG